MSDGLLSALWLPGIPRYGGGVPLMSWPLPLRRGRAVCVRAPLSRHPSACEHRAVSSVPQASQRAPQTTHMVLDIDDERLAMYRLKARRRQGPYQEQIRALAFRGAAAAAAAMALVRAPGRPLRGASLETSAECKRCADTSSGAEAGARAADGVIAEVPTLAKLTRLPCAVGVHYGWDCLRRLCDALQASAAAPGEQIYVPVVDSVLLLDNAPKELSQLAAEVTSEQGAVFAVSPELQAEFCLDVDWGEPVRFAVAWPVPRPLSAMRPPFLVLDDLVSAQNLGQLIRSAVLLGVCSFVLTRASWNCLNGRACAASEGWLYHGAFHLAEALPAALGALRRSGVRVYAAEETHTVALAPHGHDAWALVVGNEERGISQEVLAACDVQVCVPQKRGASLNVAHAASICIHKLGQPVFRHSSDSLAARSAAPGGTKV